MIHSCYAAVYSTLLQVRHRTNITYPFDPITQLTNYFPEIKLIKYSSLDPVDIAIAKKTHPYGFSIVGVTTGSMQIYYNDLNQCLKRQRFTIAHELGHLLLRHVGMLKTSRFEERCADCFARNILSPVDIIEEVDLPLETTIISEYFGITASAAQMRVDFFNTDKKNSIIPAYT
nr:MAG TPA: IrrE protein [Caudoviricetes sp.]